MTYGTVQTYIGYYTKEAHWRLEMIKLDSIIVKIKYRKYKAALEIKDKVTIISGPSATGKST